MPLILAFLFSVAIISQRTYTAAHFVDSACLALAAAVFEEFFFRGILLNNFLAKSTNTYRSYLAAVFLSSFLFGLTHLVNLAAQSWSATLLQMANAFVLGIMLAALYLRTGKLGWPIFYHFILDFTGILFNGIITKTPTVQSLKESLLVLLLYLLTGIFLLRKKLFTSWQR
ncbi:CPBP family intramembrane glutamic endopeptidase [Liquorilactobacillus sicerae]|uniref:CPBP family intramembrane glutamic endopeptidase n=1 Tax=Liquorilactobacillus sicerae TaxID=1416943 RepID=UPI00247FE39C|nr:CPBP family intramembrane glutamic endopeptidase [Liquorilactobacillus sicerae]